MTAVLVASVIIAAVTVAFQIGVATGRTINQQEILPPKLVRDEIEEMIAG